MIHSYQKPLQGERVGVVFGAFAPLHQGHLDLIMRAKKECDGGCVVIVCGHDGDKGGEMMPLARRYRYVREFFADDDLVAVYAISETELGLPNFPEGWDSWMAELESIWCNTAVQPKVDTSVCPNVATWPQRVWYVGDETYLSQLLTSDEQVIVMDRHGFNPISSEMIRENPIRNWDKITFPFRRIFSTNVLVCGTASEGKTTMVRDLGKYFNAPYSHEWARDYMEQSCVSDWELDGADYMAFLDGQYNLNKRLINSRGNHGVFFADTDSMVTRMYAEYYAKDDTCALTQEEFERVAVMADELTRKSRWDKIFLLAPKGVYVDDHFRYMGHSGEKERSEMFEILCNNIKDSGNWDKVTILNGSYYENFMVAVDYVRGIIEKGKQG